MITPYQSPNLDSGYQQFQEQQERKLQLYKSQYVYLPLFSHPLELVDKGFLQAGIIELIIPFPQTAVPGELPPEMTQNVVQQPSLRPVAGDKELLHPAPGDQPFLRVGEMSTISAQSREHTQYFSRPGMLANYTMAAQQTRGGVILKSLANVSPQQWVKLKLNEYIFGTDLKDQATGEVTRVMLPRVFDIRVQRFNEIAENNAGDALLPALMQELLKGESVARAYAQQWIDGRDAERAQGTRVKTSAKDQACLTYLGRKWAQEAANEVLKSNQHQQRDQQLEQLEMSRQNAKNTELIATAMSLLADNLGKINAAPAPASVAPPVTPPAEAAKPANKQPGKQS